MNPVRQVITSETGTAEDMEGQEGDLQYKSVKNASKAGTLTLHEFVFTFHTYTFTCCSNKRFISANFETLGTKQ